jgi:hypothetical protein
VEEAHVLYRDVEGFLYSFIESVTRLSNLFGRDPYRVWPDAVEAFGVL